MVHIFTQLNLKQGLKKFGNEGIKATKSEMKQMHDNVVLHPIRIQKNGALRELIFLKQKRCRKIKVPAVADRRKQRSVSKKYDVTSPTASTELVLITTEINSAEVRDIAMIDAPGAFLTAHMDKEVIVILENDMVDAMLEIDRKIYGKYVIYGEDDKNTCMFSSARRCAER